MSVEALIKFIEDHTYETVSTEHTVDMIFFRVGITHPGECSEPFARGLISGTKGEFADVDLFDGKEHNFIEIGAWIGDQGLALQLMALGAANKWWKLLTPRTVLPAGSIDDATVMKMAGSGMVAIQATLKVYEIPEEQKAIRAKHPWTPAMGQISGFGGDYEDACQRMFYAGLLFTEKDPDWVKRSANGIDDAFADAIVAACPDGSPSGAMVGAVAHAVAFIQRNSWEKFVEEKTKMTAADA